jgi:hypothetical protein
MSRRREAGEMYANILEHGLLLFSMLISFILAGLYIRERIKNKES